MLNNVKTPGLRLALLVGLIGLVTVSRLAQYAVPNESPVKEYLWNFSPVLAMLLFGVACFANYRIGYAIAFTALIASDLVLHGLGYAATQPIERLSIYAIYAVVGLLGFAMRSPKARGYWPVVAAGGSLLFYLLTNFVVWATMIDAPAPLGYPRTLAGLIECYTAALPFFRNALLGDLFYAAILFGTLAIAERLVPQLRLVPVDVRSS